MTGLRRIPALLCEFKDDLAGYFGPTRTRLSEITPKRDQVQRPTPGNGVGRARTDWNSAIFWWPEADGRPRRGLPGGARARRGRPEGDRRAHGAEDLDAIIGPTNGPAWVTDPVNGDLGGDFSTFIGSSGPPAVAGYANVTVPAGFVGPLPVGVSFIGGRWDEPRLIALAYAFEQATMIRVPPQFIPTIGEDASVLRQPSSKEKQKTGVLGRSGMWRMPPLR